MSSDWEESVKNRNRLKVAQRAQMLLSILLNNL